VTVLTAVDPLAWDFHASSWGFLVVAVSLIVVGHRRLQRSTPRPVRWTRPQIARFAVAVGTAALALTWPVADLAAHWSLTALVVQRLLLVLVVAPMLLLGLPHDILEWATRPAIVDATLVRLRRPPVAIVIVTVLLVGSMVPAVVVAQASSPVIRGLLAVVVLLAGLVLWLPVVGWVPGIPRLKPIVRFGYLAAQGVVPAFLSFALILAPHPLYTTFAGSRAAIHLRPLNDQQIAGFVSKLGMLLVLLSVGTVFLLRTDDEMNTDEPLVWADVQRQFERADRQGVPAVPGHRASALLPPGDAPLADRRPGDPGGQLDEP
jgi:cytochrome c oxidase assembly factor CtaG